MDDCYIGSSCEPAVQEPWGDSSKLCCDIDLVGDELEEALFDARCAATELVDTLSGGQFGFHRDRIMPCRTGCTVCYCDPCSCCRYDKLYLPFWPVCSLTRVVIDCVDQDLSGYRIDNGQSVHPYAVSLCGPWPTEQCYTDFCDPLDTGDHVSCADGGWWVEYSYGRPVPKLGHIAVNALACEFVYQCFAPDKCSLPVGTTSVSRQGVTVQVSDASSFMDAGLTGIAAADRFIRTYNPNGLRSNATFSSACVSECKPGFVRPGCLV